MIGEVHVINLSRTPARWTSFQAANAGVVPYRRFEAVDGRLADPAELVAQGVITPDLGYGPGALGAALSHLKLWRRAAAGSENLTVVEDDAILHPDFARLATELTLRAPGFDLMLWGWNFDSILSGLMFGTTPVTLYSSQPEMIRSIPAFRAASLAPTLLRLHRAFGCPCYTVSPQGARRLLAACLPLRPLQVHFPLLERTLPNTGHDLPMNAAYPGLQAWASLPPLALTPNDPAASTIQGGR